MKILQRYVLWLTLRNLALASIALTFLFLVFDFFDRVDNILDEDAGIIIIAKYFLYKIPVFFNLTLPIAMLVATLLTVGLLSKNSELTAMRAAGTKISSIAAPIFGLAFALSIASLLIAESIVPHCQRRVREIYNIDIKERHKRGSYSQNDVWWRSGRDFYTAGIFDSRTNSLLQFSKFEVDTGFRAKKRIDADYVKWVGKDLAWMMNGVRQYTFRDEQKPGDALAMDSLPLLIKEEPEDFYAEKTDPFTMSYLQLKKFITDQQNNGVPTEGLHADLYAKLSFPFVVFIATFVVLPFALTPARSGTMALGFLAGLGIGFSYYAVHSLSLAMGRAELWPALIAAWMANLLMGVVGLILNMGAEAPN